MYKIAIAFILIVGFGFVKLGEFVESETSPYVQKVKLEQKIIKRITSNQ